MPANQPKTGAERAATYRERMRAAGYKSKTVWVPDPRNAAFAAEARRQSRAAASDPHDREVMDWLEQVRDWPKD